MASGCIFGECFVCGDLVFEDQAIFLNGKWKHSYCKNRRTLKQENEALRKELEGYKRRIKGE